MLNACQQRDNVFKIKLEPFFTEDTWEGFSWKLVEVSEGNEEFNANLLRARFQFQLDNTVVATFDSDEISDEVELVNTEPNAWYVVVKPRVLSLAPGTYRWGLETTDDKPTVRTRVAGTVQVKADPVV
jgi:hypothetical protein